MNQEVLIYRKILGYYTISICMLASSLASSHSKSYCAWLVGRHLIYNTPWMPTIYDVSLKILLEKPSGIKS